MLSMLQPWTASVAHSRTKPPAAPVTVTIRSLRPQASAPHQPTAPAETEHRGGPLIGDPKPTPRSHAWPLGPIKAERHRQDDRRAAAASLGTAGVKIAKPVTLNDLWAVYLRAGAPSMKRGGGVKQDTTVKRDIERHKRFFAETLIGKARLRDIDDALVARWKASVEKVEVSRDGHRKIANAGDVGHAVTQLKALLSWGRRVHKLKTREVVEHVAARAKRRKGFFDFSELKVLRAAIDESISFYREAGKASQLQAFVAIGLFLETGARPGEEVFGWRWNWIDSSRDLGVHVMLPRDKTHPDPIPVLVLERAQALINILPEDASDSFGVC